MNYKLLILRPRHINYSKTRDIINLHREMFAGWAKVPDPKDLPWWLQPTVKPDDSTQADDR